MASESVLAGVELGGTKAITVLARGREIIDRKKIDTTTPEETLGLLRQHLDVWKSREGFAALGIASFGPISLDPGSRDNGRILATPKPGWSGALVTETLTAGLDCPWRVDTDVNAAALAEWRWGVGREMTSVVYITLGTGVGGGFVFDGEPLHGALHPEVGHLRLRRAPGDRFEGTCPFHGDCIEGLISGPALQARFGSVAAEVPDDDQTCAFVQHDLVELIEAIALMVSPQVVLIGGGVGMRRPFLLAGAREQLVERLGNYLPHISSDTVSGFVSNPRFGEDAGPMGAIALAQAALDDSRSQSSRSNRA